MKSKTADDILKSSTIPKEHATPFTTPKAESKFNKGFFGLELGGKAAVLIGVEGAVRIGFYYNDTD
jgi:hypothetical protein